MSIDKRAKNTYNHCVGLGPVQQSHQSEGRGCASNGNKHGFMTSIAVVECSRSGGVARFVAISPEVGGNKAFQGEFYEKTRG